MWAKIFQMIAQFLLIPIIKDISAYVMKTIKRKSEQKERHEDNKEKVENYENNSSGGFGNLP